MTHELVCVEGLTKAEVLCVHFNAACMPQKGFHKHPMLVQEAADYLDVYGSRFDFLESRPIFLQLAQANTGLNVRLYNTFNGVGRSQKAVAIYKATGNVDDPDILALASQASGRDVCISRPVFDIVTLDDDLQEDCQKRGLIDRLLHGIFH